MKLVACIGKMCLGIDVPDTEKVHLDSDVVDALALYTKYRVSKKLLEKERPDIFSQWRIHLAKYPSMKPSKINYMNWLHSHCMQDFVQELEYQLQHLQIKLNG